MTALEKRAVQRGPKPRPDANKQLVHLRISPELYDQLRAWAKEDDVSLSHELRALALVGRLLFERPEFVLRLVQDPKANRTQIVRDLERDARLLLEMAEGGRSAVVR
jgi:hypothetical protein